MEIYMLNKIYLIRAKIRLQKARNNYNAAKRLLNEEFYDSAIDRAYFCIYQAAGAVCAFNNKDIADFSSIAENFQFCYIDEGYFDNRFYEILQEAFKSRYNCNYIDCYIETKEEARRNIANAKTFLEAMENYTAHAVWLDKSPND
jgi:uncharacterized protein (UPF0332 family)